MFGFRRTQYIPELGLFYNVWGFYMEGSEYGLDYWGDFGKKFRRIRKEDKLNYKI